VGHPPSIKTKRGFVNPTVEFRFNVILFAVASVVTVYQETAELKFGQAPEVNPDENADILHPVIQLGTGVTPGAGVTGVGRFVGVEQFSLVAQPGGGGETPTVVQNGLS